MSGRIARSEQLLTAGAVLLRHLTADRVEAIVRDGLDVRTIRWTAQTGWTCTCTAITPACTHVYAVRQVVILDPAGRPA